MRSPHAIERYLHEHIPLTAALGVSVTRADDRAVELSAPLTPNLNHEANAFGGSISAVAIVTGWTWLWGHLEEQAEPSRIVIQRSEVDYLHPIQEAFRATCTAPPPDAWARLLEALGRRGRGRIVLACEVRAGDQVAARFTGWYVVMR